MALPQDKKDSMQLLVELSSSYVEEARQAKQNRMRLDRINFNAYHLIQDWTHKQKGQSKEFLAKQPMAVEQITTFISQGLVDIGQWFSVEKNAGVQEQDLLITPEEVQQILGWALEECDYLTFTSDSVKLGLLQSLMISKIHGQYCDKPIYYTESKEKDGKYVDVLKKVDKKIWKPKVELLRSEDFYPDPTGKGLYLIHETYMDLHELYSLSEGENAIYMKDRVELLHGGYVEADDQSARKARETNQNIAFSGYRKKVKIWECWGNILDSNTGKLLEKNKMWTVADGRVVIQEPKDYPFWHGKIPMVVSALIRVPHSVWHKSLMDAPTQTNVALNELYNLMIDAGMNDAHGIKQIRTEWLDDETQISNGIYPGISLKVGSNCPPGAKVLERVDTSTMSPEAFNVFQMMSAEFSASSLTNDLRMGVLPNRAVKATEVVEASQSITSVFTGVAKVLEVSKIEPELEMMWSNVLQNLDEMDEAVLADIVGPERARQILSISKEQRFAKCATGYKFKVFGISRILAKQKDFKKLTAFLQTVFSMDLLAEEFMKEYSPAKLLAEIMDALDVNDERLKISDEEKAALQMAAEQQQAQQQMGPDMQSQIPQAGAQEGGDSVEGRIPRSDFGKLENKAVGGMR